MTVGTGRFLIVIMQPDPPPTRKAPWWAYLLFIALLAPLGLMSRFCYSALNVMLSGKLEGLSDWYAAVIFALFGTLLLWYVLSVGWRIIRGRW